MNGESLWMCFLLTWYENTYYIWLDQTKDKKHFYLIDRFFLLFMHLELEFNQATMQCHTQIYWLTNFTSWPNWEENERKQKYLNRFLASELIPQPPCSGKKALTTQSLYNWPLYNCIYIYRCIYNEWLSGSSIKIRCFLVLLDRTVVQQEIKDRSREWLLTNWQMQTDYARTSIVSSAYGPHTLPTELKHSLSDRSMWLPECVTACVFGCTLAKWT